MTRFCVWCGSTAVRSGARFCSRACYWAHWREHQIKPRCDVDDCDRPSESLGLCDRHYQRLRNYGRTSSPRDLSLEGRFWAKVAIAGPADCWEWQGTRNEHGYGRFQTQNTPPIRVYAHRFAYQSATGVDVALGIVMHECDNPPCCNPAHLRRGTQSENVADMHAKGRANLIGLEAGWARRRRPPAQEAS